VQRCSGADTEVQKCRCRGTGAGVQVQKYRGSGMQGAGMQGCRGAEVVQRWCRGDEGVIRCAEMQR